MDNVLAERAQQLFLLGDKERKGFIVKRDMQHMRSEVPLTPDQLEAVFDSLDVEGNRYLTMQQFLSGFGEYVSLHAGAGSGEDPAQAADDGEYSGDGDLETHLACTTEGSRRLAEVLHQLGDIAAFAGLQQLCRQVQAEGSRRILEALVVFLQQLWRELANQRQELALLQQACHSNQEIHRTDMLKLCEDLESQMKEKDDLKRKEEGRAAMARSRLSEELQRREKQLLELQDDHQQMAARVYELKAAVTASKKENAQLLVNKMELECDLQKSQDRTSQLQRCLESLRAEVSWDRQKYISAGFQLARTILVEQQGLKRQLQLLKSISATLEGDERRSEEGNEFGTQTCVHCACASDEAACLDYEYDEDFHKAKDDRAPLRSAQEIGGGTIPSTSPCLREELEESCSAEMAAVVNTGAS